MILYVNGDSHAAAAEAVNPHAWAFDDGKYWNRGKEPHPDNDAVSFGRCLATHLGADYVNQSQAGCSNARIIRTTRDWLQQQEQFDNIFVLLQWTTWEREEWWHNGEDYQVNASGIDHVPTELQDRYKNFVINIDWDETERYAHEQIWQFHRELQTNNIRHLMFNGNNWFRASNPRDWATNYIAPYQKDATFDAVLRKNGFKTVSPQSWHFGADAHCFWGKYLLQYIVSNKINVFQNSSITQTVCN